MNLSILLYEYPNEQKNSYKYTITSTVLCIASNNANKYIKIKKK